MDLHTILASGSDDETLKCFVCGNYLSYFPISVCSNNQSICGRCVLPEGITSFHEAAFETIVQSLRFPCRYKSEGCFEELQPKDVPRHEENCPFRIVKCIMNGPKNCEWSGSLPTLIEHCQNEHSDIFLKNGEFETDLSRSMESQHLIEVDDKLFIFMKKFDLDSKILRCAVSFNEYESDVESYTCQFSVTKGNTTILHDFESTIFGENIFEQLYFQFASEGDNQQLVRAKISLRKKGISKEKHVQENEANISKLRDFLKCPECGILAAISTVRDAESTTIQCADCKTCIVKNSKNTLEEKIMGTVIALLTLPCDFEEYGCTYRSDYEKVQNHKKNCDSRESCPYHKAKGCQWKGPRKDIASHILQQHAEKISKFKEKLTVPISKPEWHFHIIKFNNCLFRLDRFVKKDRCLFYSVKKLSICKQKFGFEIEVIDPAEPSGFKRHVMTQNCGQFTNKYEVFSADCCIFPKEQVFGVAEDATFKVNVFKM